MEPALAFLSVLSHPFFGEGHIVFFIEKMPFADSSSRSGWMTGVSWHCQGETLFAKWMIHFGQPSKCLFIPRIMFLGSWEEWTQSCGERFGLSETSGESLMILSKTTYRDWELSEVFQCLVMNSGCMSRKNYKNEFPPKYSGILKVHRRELQGRWSLASQRKPTTLHLGSLAGMVGDWVIAFFFF